MAGSFPGSHTNQLSQLTQEQHDAFWRDGYLLVEDAVSPALLTRLRDQFSRWVEVSRTHDQPWDETINGLPRFHLEAAHRPDKPCLQRVNAPVEVSAAYFEAMSDSPMTAMVADLIGPDVKFHHSKINSKLPGGNTAVKWHQDFPFTPHSNDDLITALLMVDEVTLENGPLDVLPASHTGPIHSLWHEGRFTGSVEASVAEQSQRDSVRCTGPAGTVCLMHTRLLHGSAPNLSTRPRTLFISVYSAEDAIKQSPNPMPNRYEGLIVAGRKTNRVRSLAYDIELPQLPSTGSFFDQQAKPSG
ncbi:MAG: phytanoyl-CoA dioxygenase family protein [Burkholderiaceae bacterium]